jgi:mannose-6-phosphate isomerase
VWGGRTLETRYHRRLPDGPVGESWELVDRPEAVSRVASGPLAGLDLHSLWVEQPTLFGPLTAPRSSRFPLLIKLLDCAETLSVQVHPDARAAAALGGEPKSEVWIVLEAAPGAELYAGLRRGTARTAFEAALDRGGREVVPMLHRLSPAGGDMMRIPAGRLHAIGAGNLLCEIQQNSDTTYRIYDWDRRGLDGRPRPLHLEASLRCIDFEDFEPGLEPRDAGPIEVLEAPRVRLERIAVDRPLRLAGAAPGGGGARGRGGGGLRGGGGRCGAGRAC